MNATETKTAEEKAHRVAVEESWRTIHNLLRDHKDVLCIPERAIITALERAYMRGWSDARKAARDP